MANREERILIFQDTMRLCGTHPFLRQAVGNSIETQKLYWEGETVDCGAPRFAAPAAVEISKNRSMEAARAYTGSSKRVCVLNFASAVSPGGGVVTGCTAQEESICRISSLYPALTDQDTAGAFYARHHAAIRARTMNRRNTDDCIYTPGVVVFKEDTHDCAPMPESDWYSVDVLTCAAPDQREDTNGAGYHPDEKELRACFEQRIEMILRVAAANEADVLVLGAFGCGAFYNPPALVAEAFHTVIQKYALYFEKIVFAIYVHDYETENYKAFANIFADNK